jgi:hypothetical protein
MAFTCTKGIYLIHFTNHNRLENWCCALQIHLVAHLVVHALQVERLNDQPKQEAEIAAFFGRYDEACELYKKMGRMDLAVQLFVRLGHWERVEGMIKVSCCVDSSANVQPSIEGDRPNPAAPKGPARIKQVADD